MKRNAFRLILITLALTLAAGLMPGIAGAAASGSTAGKVAVSFGVLNVRSAASSTASVLTVLQKDSYVTLISKSGSWWRVEYGEGKYGYCHADYIAPVSGSYAVHATGHLNVRSGPGTGNGVIGWLQPGEYVVVLSTAGTWHRILYDGAKTGYASGNYLSAGYASVSLGVPSYKQTDSRWAAKGIGTSGGTIGSIGCPTTALAMTESYRTKTTIYPDKMADMLSYTAGGAVYWPTNYQAYAESDYLKAAYGLLSSGIPVLLGARNASGGQHWCVITGFSGGSLSAANFLINDPGSNARTTLQQLFAVYPYFYKLMHY